MLTRPRQAHGAEQAFAWAWQEPAAASQVLDMGFLYLLPQNYLMVSPCGYSFWMFWGLDASVMTGWWQRRNTVPMQARILADWREEICFFFFFFCSLLKTNASQVAQLITPLIWVSLTYVP